MDYHVDIVMCIDLSISMSPIINLVKDHALNFHGELASGLGKQQKRVDSLRIKVIGFHGVYDSPPQFQILDFVSLPQQAPEFREFVSGFKTRGGADEAGFEALAIAMGSDWTRQQGRMRHIVMLYTDEPPHALEKPEAGLECTWNGRHGGLEQMLAANGQPMIPKSFSDLCGMWYTHLDDSARRLIVFSKGHKPWTELTSTLDNSMHVEIDLRNVSVTESIFVPLINSI